MDLNKIAIKGTAQDHLPIEDIKENLVILRDGSCAMILETSSVNFDLLSEKEQEAMIYAYAAILNSLTFPIQILVRSSLKDVSSYLNHLKRQEVKMNDPLLRKQIVSYRRFIEEMVQKNNVLAKSFYIVVPFYAVELGIQAAAKSSFSLSLPFLTKQTDKELPANKEVIIDKAKTTLLPKKDHLIRLFNRLGLTIKQLTTKELIRLLYRIYNQESVLGDDSVSFSKRGALIKERKKSDQDGFKHSQKAQTEEGLGGSEKEKLSTSAKS